MNNQIYQMITENIEFMKMIIQGKSIISYKTPVYKIPDSFGITYITDCLIVDNIVSVIRMKRAVKTVGIDQHTENADNECWEKAVSIILQQTCRFH